MEAGVQTGISWGVIAAVGSVAVAIFALFLQLGRDREKFGRELGRADQQVQDHSARLNRIEELQKEQGAQQQMTAQQLAHLDGGLGWIKDTLGRLSDNVEQLLKGDRR